MAYFHSPRIVTDGLILALDAANTKSYPGSGTTWFDLSGNGYNFSLLNSPSYSNGFFSFDGTNQYATLTNANLYLPPTAIRTIEIWTRIIAFPVFTGGLFSGQRNSTGSLEVSPSGKFIWRWDDGNTGNSNTTLLLNEWNHITIVLNNYFATYYYNGQLDKAATQNTDLASSQVTTWSIGRQNRNFSGNFYYLNCDVSTARQYNRELTAAEILQNYNATKGRYGL